MKTSPGCIWVPTGGTPVIVKMLDRVPTSGATQVAPPNRHDEQSTMMYADVFGEFVEDERREDPLGEANREALKGRIEEAMQGLNYREREILRMRFGLTDGYAYTLEEVGKVFSVTRERVRQIESKAVRLEQQPHRARSLSPFVEGVDLPRGERL